jgi:hypothetical protein
VQEVLLVVEVKDWHENDSLEEYSWHHQGSEPPKRSDWRDLTDCASSKRNRRGKRGDQHGAGGLTPRHTKPENGLLPECFVLEGAPPEVMEHKDVVTANAQHDEDYSQVQSREVRHLYHVVVSHHGHRDAD